MGLVGGHWIAITILNLLVGRIDVDMVVRVVSRVDRNLINRLVVRIVRKRRGWLLLANVISKGLACTAASGVSRKFVELIEFVLDLVEAQGLGLAAVGSGDNLALGVGHNRLGIFEVRVIRKLERKLLHLAALYDLGHLRSPGAGRGVRSVLVGEGLFPVGTVNRIIALVVLFQRVS